MPCGWLFSQGKRSAWQPKSRIHEVQLVTQSKKEHQLKLATHHRYKDSTPSPFGSLRILFGRDGPWALESVAIVSASGGYGMIWTTSKMAVSHVLVVSSGCHPKKGASKYVCTHITSLLAVDAGTCHWRSVFLDSCWFFRFAMHGQ